MPSLYRYGLNKFVRSDLPHTHANHAQAESLPLKFMIKRNAKFGVAAPFWNGVGNLVFVFMSVASRTLTGYDGISANSFQI
jgi:hypothetical protein